MTNPSGKSNRVGLVLISDCDCLTRRWVCFNFSLMKGPLIMSSPHPSKEKNKHLNQNQTNRQTDKKMLCSRPLCCSIGAPPVFSGIRESLLLCTGRPLTERDDGQSAAGELWVPAVINFFFFFLSERVFFFALPGRDFFLSFIFYFLGLFICRLWFNTFPSSTWKSVFSWLNTSPCPLGRAFFLDLSETILFVSLVFAIIV